MCRTLDSPQLVHLQQPQHFVAADMASTQRNTLAKPMKPKLSRRITKSPRINLNNYWNQFKEIMDEEPDDELTNATNIVNENLENERKLALMVIRDHSEDKKLPSEKSETGLRSGGCDVTLQNIQTADYTFH